MEFNNLVNGSIIKLKAKRKEINITENTAENLILAYATIQFHYYIKEQFSDDYLFF